MGRGAGCCGAARRRALRGCAVRTSKPGSGRERGFRGAARPGDRLKLREPGEREGSSRPRRKAAARTSEREQQQCGGRRGSLWAAVLQRSRRRRRRILSPGAGAGGRQRRGRAPKPRRGDRASSPRRRRPPKTGTATTQRRRGSRPAQPRECPAGPTPLATRTPSLASASLRPRPGPDPEAASIFSGWRWRFPHPHPGPGVGGSGPSCPLSARPGPLAGAFRVPRPSRNLVLAGAAPTGLRPGAPGTSCAPARPSRFSGGAVGARVWGGRASGARPSQLSLPPHQGSGPPRSSPPSKLPCDPEAGEHLCDLPLGNTA